MKYVKHNLSVRIRNATAKKKVGVVFGGMSTEHDVSIMSAESVINNLNKEEYEVTSIYIDKNGSWYENKTKPIENICTYVKKFDVIFPVLHGLYGEDGTIQGMFEMLKIPYVGCKVLASSLCMDKAYANIIFEKAGIKRAKYIYIKKYNDKYICVDEKMNEEICDIEKICALVEEKIGYPNFVKPSNSGSSVGINKSKDKKELIDNIKHAEVFDIKILIEEGINGREIECSVIGNEDVKASVLGEIVPKEEFYSYNAKYITGESAIVIPANISDDLSNEIRKIAIKAFKAVDGKGLARVDFFVEKETNQIYLNEINTMPGFTDISMYPKLWERAELTYKDLLEKLINLALKNK